MTERRDIPTLLENITSTTGITSKAITSKVINMKQ